MQKNIAPLSPPFSRKLALPGALSFDAGGSEGAPPVCEVEPTISGDAWVGGATPLVCSTGTWTGSGISYSYQWYDGDTEEEIPGQNQNEYPPASPDYGKNLYCIVTATNAFGSDSAMSDVVQVLQAYDIFVWGQNTTFNTGATQNTPFQIGSDKDWYQICTTPNASAGTSGFAVDTSGRLWAWGGNAQGQLGLNNQTSPIDTLTQVGTDTDWKNCIIQQAGTLSFAIKNGKLYSCGVGTNGQLANNTSSGNVLVFTQVGTDEDWAYCAISTSGGHAIKNNGTLWAWGIPTNYRHGNGVNTGNLLVPTQIGSDVDWRWIGRGNVSAGCVHGIKENGTLWGWGQNPGKALGMGTAGVDVQTITQVGTDTDWAETSGTSFGAFFRKTDGRIYAIGSSATNDELGLGDGVTATSITQIGSDTDWVKIAGCPTGGVALKENGDLYSWGDAPGTSGQGSGTTDYAVPTKINALSNVADVWTNAGGVCALVRR